MPEPLNVLKHHVIKFAEYAEVYHTYGVNPTDADFQMDGLHVTRELSGFRISKTGEPAYPDVSTNTLMARNAARVIKSIHRGDVVEIPDQNPDGSQNFDLVCRSCPNIKSRNKTGLCRIANCRLVFHKP
ncbi:hypothetical protein ACFL2C_03725 [Patescibacteria group bacterium]